MNQRICISKVSNESSFNQRKEKSIDEKNTNFEVVFIPLLQLVMKCTIFLLHLFPLIFVRHSRSIDKYLPNHSGINQVKRIYSIETMLKDILIE